MNLPERVAERTQQQIADYVGSSDVTGVPLLDTTIDWDVAANWPDRFVFEGREYELEVSAYIGDEPPRVLGSREEIPPGTTFAFGYNPAPAIEGERSEGIFPRASWGRRDRLPGKTLIWGTRGFCDEPWLVVFQHESYPEGEVQSFYFQTREGGNQWEYFDRDGNLLGLKTGRDCFWNGEQVTEKEFTDLTFEIWDSCRER